MQVKRRSVPLLQWSELSKAQQREAEEFFDRIFENSVDRHGNPITWARLEDNERGEAYGKLLKFHHDRNKPEHAFMKAQDDKRKAKVKAESDRSERLLRVRLQATRKEDDETAMRLYKAMKAKEEKDKQDRKILAKRKRELNKRLKATR